MAHGRMTGELLGHGKGVEDKDMEGVLEYNRGMKRFLWHNKEACGNRFGTERVLGYLRQIREYWGMLRHGRGTEVSFVHVRVTREGVEKW